MLKFLWSSYIVWNTVFIITVLCWFCPVMSVDNWQDENMPANIVNSRISSNSAVKRHGNSVFIPTDINMWHFALLHSLIFFFFASSDPIPSHLFSTYSVILFINSIRVELQKPCLLSIYVYGSFLTYYEHTHENTTANVFPLSWSQKITCIANLGCHLAYQRSAFL